MKKMIVVSIIVVITIIYGAVGAVLFTDIQLLQSPDTTITLSVLEINADEAIVHAMIEIANPNSFEISTRDFELTLLTGTGVQVGHITLAGDEIPSNEKKVFNVTIPIGFKGEQPDILRAKLSGIVGINVLGFVKKTLPLTFTVITSVNDILAQFQAPTIHLSADFSNISEKGINVSGSFTVFNPNAFDIYVDNLSTDITTDNGSIVGTLHLVGGTIQGKQSQVLYGHGELLLVALNAESLSICLPVHAGVRVGGFDKSFTVDVETQIIVPDLDTLLTSHQPLDLVIKADYRIKLNGVDVNFTMDIINPHNITLVAKDLSATVFMVKNDQKQKIGFGEIGNGTIPPRGSLHLVSNIVIPPAPFFTSIESLLSSDWVLTTVRGNLTVQGLHKYFWIGISGYEDLHPFR